MDWNRILKTLKANGYTGSDDLAAVKAFAASFDLVGEDGKAIDLDAAYTAAKNAKRALVVPSEEPPHDPSR